jgi:flagellin
MATISSKTALVALQGMRSANADMSKSAERLATGLKVNRPSDDPAGFGKASVLKAEIGSFVQVKKNLLEANAELDKVGSAMTTITDYLVEMRTLALAAASETNSSTKTAYQSQFAELRTGITELATNTKFFSNTLGAGGTVNVQSGIQGGEVKALTISAVAVGTSSLSIDTIDLSGSVTAANISAIGAAINTVSTQLARIGAYQTSLEARGALADANILAKTSQYKDIMEADLAAEATNLAAARIRQDSATAVLAQANSMNRTITDYLLSGAMG